MKCEEEFFRAVCVCVSVFVWGKNTKSRKNVSFETLLKVFAFVFFVSFGVLPFVGPSFTLTAFHPVLAKISKWNCCIICTFRIFICVCPILPHRKKFSINFARLSFGEKQSVNKTAQDEPQFPTRLDLSSLSKRPTKRKLKLKCCQDICWIIQQLVPTAGNSSLFQLSSILFLWAHSFFFWCCLLWPSKCKFLGSIAISLAPFSSPVLSMSLGSSSQAWSGN